MTENLPNDFQQTGSEKIAPEPVGNKSWVRIWLVYLVFYYPFYWASQFLVFSLPALIHVALFRYRLEHLYASFGGLFAAVAPPASTVNLKPASRYSDHYQLVVTLLLVLAVIGFLAAVRRSYRGLAGLAAAILGNVGLLRPLWRLLIRKQLGAEVALEALVFFIVLCLGLRWILNGVSVRGYWARVGILLPLFGFPIVVLLGVVSIRFGFRDYSEALLVVVPWVLASLLVSFRSRVPHERLRAGWKTIAWAISASLLVSVIIPPVARAVNRVLERRRLAVNRAAMAAYAEIPRNLPFRKLFFQKGVNFTAEFPNPYDSQGARQMLEILPQYGVNAVALVPYGGSSGHPPRVHFAGENSWESDEGLEELSRVAHARGVKVMLKPAIWEAYNLEYSSPQDRATWFDQYRIFLEHYARLASRIHADLFCLGGEFTHLTPYDAEWRRLIAGVRQLYPGPLVYAANFGQEFEHVQFWDALDYIGLQEYYPLPDNLSTDSIVEKVEAVQRKYQRPVIFTEAGFSTHHLPNRQPWDDAPGKIALADQARCYEAVFRAFYHKPWFQGMYWWKVETNASGGPEDVSHTPWGKPAMDVVARWYLQGGR